MGRASTGSEGAIRAIRRIPGLLRPARGRVRALRRRPATDTVADRAVLVSGHHEAGGGGGGGATRPTSRGTCAMGVHPAMPALQTRLSAVSCPAAKAWASCAVV